MTASRPFDETLDDLSDLTMVDEGWPGGDNPDLRPVGPFIPRRHALLSYLKKNIDGSRSWG